MEQRIIRRLQRTIRDPTNDGTWQDLAAQCSSGSTLWLRSLESMLCLMEPVCLLTKRRPQEVSFDPSLVSAHIAGQSIQRNLARPHREGKGPLGSRLRGFDLDSCSGFDAGEVANAHEHTHFLRTQPHRRVGALVVALPEQQPPDCSSQCKNHGRRRAERHRVDIYAIDATPSTRLSG